MTNSSENKQLRLPDNWAQMTAEQRRQYRLNTFVNPPDVKFINPSAEKAYKARAQRLVDAYNLQEPDRVPVQLPVGNLPYVLYGTNMHTTMYDFQKAYQAYQQFNDKYAEELEFFALPSSIPGKALDILDFKLYAWPGHGLDINAPEYQFREGEYMKVEEYETLIRDPSDFWLRTYLPRIFGSMESLRLLQPLTNIVEVPCLEGLPLGRPEVRETLRKLLDAGEEYQKRADIIGGFLRTGQERGFPIGGSLGLICKAPFDVLGDTLRGTTGVMMDLYRRPDKVLAALDVFTDLTIKAMLNLAGNPRVCTATFPLHKGADGWMSQKQFEKFYWPTLKKVLDAFINEGLTVTLFAEGSYNSRLEYVNEFPKGAINWWFDQTDMARAKQILGNKSCIQGNVPSSLILTASPAAVKEYCRKLIEDCGQGGGFILAAGSVGENPKLDNLRAMMAAAREYGVYRK